MSSGNGDKTTRNQNHIFYVSTMILINSGDDDRKSSTNAPSLAQV